LALKGLHKIYRSLNDLVNTKEKREYIIIICVPFYILYGITVLISDIGFPTNGVFAIFVILWLAFLYLILWLAFLYLFFFQTKRGKKLREIVEEQ